MIDILILAGMLNTTVPATPAPEQYAATAYALPGQEVHWRGHDNRVNSAQSYERCGTVPGQSNVLLGGITLQEAAALQLTVWRLDARRWMQVMHCAQFFGGACCGPWGQPRAPACGSC